MGASGGGKTSLLDVLADRKDAAGVSGTVLVNGKPRDKATFMHQSGYVVQDDVVMGTLTVRENLMFSANLRLPESISVEEKARRVEEVIEELGLGKVADSKVGNEMVRGVSGGERKRVNIGMELITSPSMLFLDEPTTGLDASTSMNVLRILKRLSLKGRTIVLSIHQPQSKIFELFDSVTLLTDGHIVHHGPSKDMVAYFDSIGYKCGQFNNPADFALDVITGEEPREGSKRRRASNEDPAEKKAALAETQKYLSDSYQASGMAAEARRAFEAESAGKTLGTEGHHDEYRGTYGASWTKQVAVCSRRAFLNVIRNPATSIGQVVVNIIVGIIVGLIFYRIDQHTDVTSMIRDYTGCMFFICVNLQFSNLSAIEIFLKERVIFIHEKASGYYYTSAYFASKLLCDMIPVRVIPTIIFATVVYFMVGFQRQADKYFWFVFVCVLQSVVAASVCFCFSAKFSILAIANLCTTMWYVFMMIFSGLLVSINSWPDYSRWLGYISFCKYSYELLLEDQFTGLVLPCVGNDPCYGEKVLGPQYLDISTDPKGIKVMALLIMIVGFLSIGYYQLTQLRRH